MIRRYEHKGAKLTIGMREDLSDMVTQTFEPSKLPMSLKFVAYGKLLEVSLYFASSNLLYEWGQQLRPGFTFPREKSSGEQEYNVGSGRSGGGTTAGGWRAEEKAVAGLNER